MIWGTRPLYNLTIITHDHQFVHWKFVFLAKNNKNMFLSIEKVTNPQPMGSGCPGAENH
jgi:hypothetical protein